jgi:hypothetical protein
MNRWILTPDAPWHPERGRRAKVYDNGFAAGATDRAPVASLDDWLTVHEIRGSLLTPDLVDYQVPIGGVPPSQLLRGAGLPSAWWAGRLPPTPWSTAAGSTAAARDPRRRRTK